MLLYSLVEFRLIYDDDIGRPPTEIFEVTSSFSLMSSNTFKKPQRLGVLTCDHDHCAVNGRSWCEWRILAVNNSDQKLAVINERKVTCEWVICATDRDPR